MNATMYAGCQNCLNQFSFFWLVVPRIKFVMSLPSHSAFIVWLCTGQHCPHCTPHPTPHTALVSTLPTAPHTPHSALVSTLPTAPHTPHSALVSTVPTAPHTPHSAVQAKGMALKQSPSKPTSHMALKCLRRLKRAFLVIKWAF